MARDIKQQAIQGPLVGQLSGFANAQGYGVSVDKSDFMRDSMPNLLSAVGKVMDIANTEAFRKGQTDQASDMLNMNNTVDSAAALIKESSWLTRDAYSQGVKYQEYTEGQLETQAAIQKQVAASVTNGDTIDVFSQKIKPHLASLNKKMHSFNLQGKAKELAQDQILAYTVNAQQQYQSAAEGRAKLLFDRGVAQEASGAIGMLTNAQSADDVIGTLENTSKILTNTTAAFDPKTSVQATASYMAGIVEEFSGRVVGASPVDAMRIDATLGWLYNSPEAKKLPLKERSNMIDSMTKAQDKVHEFNYNQVNVQIDTAERSFREQGVFDSDMISNGLDYVADGEAGGTISTSHARALRKRLGNFYTAADKDTPKLHAYLTATGAELDGQGLNRVTADKAMYAQMLNAASGHPMANMATIGQGMLLNRPGLVQLGSKGAVQMFESRLGMSSEQLLEDEGAGVANEANKSMGDTFKKFIGDGRIDLAYKMLDAFQDPIQKEVMRIAWSEEGPTPDLGTEFSMRYESLYNGIAAGGDDNYNVTFTPDAINMGWLGKVSNAASSDRWYGQSDAMKEWQVRNIQETYNLHGKSLFKANRQRFAKDEDGSGAIRAMLSAGLLINTKTQVLAVSPQQRMSMGGGVAASDDRIIKGMDAIAEDAIVRVGKVEPHLFSLVKNKVDRENIHIEVTNSGVIVGAMDDDGRTIGSPMYYSHGDVYKLSTPAADATVMYSGDINTAGFKFKVEADDGTFGSNTLKTSTLKHLFVQEGYHNSTRASDPSRPDVVTFGHGVTPSAAKDMLGESKAAKFEEAAKDKGSEEYQKYFNEFTNSYFKSLKGLSVEAGLPEPSNDVSTLRYKGAYLAIADVMYHGGISGGGNAMVKILNLAKSDKNAARKLMQQQPFYIQTGKDSGRKEFLLRAIDLVD